MANRYWVGGTGTWNASDTTHWATASNGAGGASVPGSADAVIFDASSGGGVVTVDHPTLTIQSYTFGAFTGTIDHSVNNQNVDITGLSTAALSGTGTGVRTFRMGSGTWTIRSTALSTVFNFGTVTNLTFSGASANIVITGTNPGRRTLAPGGLTFGSLTIDANPGRGSTTVSSAFTVANLNIGAPNHVMFNNSTTYTVTNAFTWTGTAAAPIGLVANADTGVATIAAAGGGTIDYAAIRQLTFTGAGAKVANNSYDLGINVGITITPPEAGGGGAGYPVKVWNGSAWASESLKVWDGTEWSAGAAAGPSGPSGSLLVSYTPGSDRNDFTGEVGVRLGIGASPFTVDWIGARRHHASQTGTHTVKLYEWFTQVVQRTAIIDYTCLLYTSPSPRDS